MDVVTEVLSSRSDQTEGFNSMVGASVIAHAILFGLILLFGVTGPAAQREVIMHVSLGAGSEPRDGGLATLGGRPIQEVTETKRAIEPVRPPSAPEPEMVEPTKVVTKKPPPPSPPAQTPMSRTPTKGAQTEAGSAVAETGAKGQGFGLSSGGGGSAGYLDVANFCCPEYLATMQDLVFRNWDFRQRVDGATLVKFIIQRDGRIIDVQVERSSGTAALDFLATRSLLLTRQLPPLPAAFDQPSLTVHLVFEYRR